MRKVCLANAPVIALWVLRCDLILMVSFYIIVTKTVTFGVPLSQPARVITHLLLADNSGYVSTVEFIMKKLKVLK